MLLAYSQGDKTKGKLMHNPIDSGKKSVDEISTTELAQVLAQRLMITSGRWHRLKSNRKARALEQAAVSLVLLLKDQPQEALVRLQQASGWLDKSINPLPCPSHGDQQTSNSEKLLEEIK
ncbi:hypothetical protein AVDCRST_MAG81-842 [uncultured Synechococcales cyanobacterium]|uniref:Uncharacterized protein n=1 Tax=uncultured Synechococcales cyanobacterium TaxID=1936017 RepID=A0A6J4V0C1_9CYAN|nr:hypothetical protein AVDCRST_MAG81-842 [uncultured Synechococcales cyanobacterium]